MTPDQRPQRAGEHRRLAPGGEQAASAAEVWSLDLITNDRSLAVVVELGFSPASATGWYWFFIAGPDRKLIAVVDDELRVPNAGLEVRAPGLWTELCAQVDFDHFTVDLEAFGVELDAPADLLASGYGKRVALGAELEWDTIGPVVEVERGYECPCLVHGELLIDDAVIEIDGRGWRSHAWSGERIASGLRGFGAAGPVRSAMSPLRYDSAAHASTSGGYEHHMVIDTDVVGWWRGPAELT